MILVAAGNDERQPVVMVTTPDGCGVCQIAYVCGAGAVGQVVADQTGHGHQRRRRSRGEWNNDLFGLSTVFVAARNLCSRRSLFHDQVRVRPSESERAYARNRRSPVFWPRLEVALHPDRKGIEGDVRVRLGKMQTGGGIARW